MSKLFHFKIDQPEKANIIVNTFVQEMGSLKEGHFSWMGVEGTYNLHDQFFDLTITDKPHVLSWSIIEANLEKFLKEIHLVA